MNGTTQKAAKGATALPPPPKRPGAAKPQPEIENGAQAKILDGMVERLFIRWQNADVAAKQARLDLDVLMGEFKELEAARDRDRQEFDRVIEDLRAREHRLQEELTLEREENAALRVEAQHIGEVASGMRERASAAVMRSVEDRNRRDAEQPAKTEAGDAALHAIENALLDAADIQPEAHERTLDIARADEVQPPAPERRTTRLPPEYEK